MARRSFLTMAVGAAAACPLCLLAASRQGAEAQAVHTAPHWDYTGAAAPERWGNLSPDFRVCSLGMEQTPVDLTGAIRAEAGAVEPNFQPMPLRIVNNGHTIQVNCPPGSTTKINGATYDLAQFHFHHPSEHLLNGSRFDLECHFVHRNAAGDLAVVGVFLRPGAANAALEPIWQAMPAKEGPEVQTAATIRPADLLPRDRAYFRYFGSLTTPPCSEGVLWTVYRDPIEISREQVVRFAQLFPANARPVMPLNRRFLLEAN